MREETGYNEIEYLEFEGNRFLIVEGTLRDVQVENKVVRIPDIVTEIRRQAFLDDRLIGKMEILIIPDSVQKIERLSFAGMAHLKLVELKALIATLEQGMFRNCMELEAVILPNTLRKIESRAFENCLQLVKVELPRVWVQMAEDAFLNCVRLKDKRIEKGRISSKKRRIGSKKGPVPTFVYRGEEGQGAGTGRNRSSTGSGRVTGGTGKRSGE